MAAVGFCGLAPLLFRRKSCAVEAMKGRHRPKKPSRKARKERIRETIENTFIGADQLILMMAIQRKLLAFRDVMDFAPCNNSVTLREMIIMTLEDLQRFYPDNIPSNEVSTIKGKSIDKGLTYLCKALTSLGETWMMNNDCIDKLNYQLPSLKENANTRELGETVLASLDCMTKMASEKFDIMDEDDQKKDFSPRSSSLGKSRLGSSSFSDSNFSWGSSPVTPTSVLPEMMKYSARAGDSLCTSRSSSLLWSLRVQAVGKLNPIVVKRLSFHMSPPRKIEEEPTRDMEVDVKSNNSEKDSSDDLVFELDITEESDSKSGDHEEASKPQTMAELGLRLSPRPLHPSSPKPAQTPLLLQQLPSPSLSPSPPPSPPPTPTLAPPSPPRLSVIRPYTVPLPAPPPPPPSAPQLQKNAVALGLPAPPPPPSLSHGSGSAAAAPPPPPPMTLKGGSVPAPPPSIPHGNGAAPPPPPPLGAGRSLRPKATTKLKRSTHIGHLYRTLKGKLEGNSLNGKSSGGRKSAVGASTGGKQGMADALAEMTKRSSYFQQIEEDVQKYKKQITEMRSAITNFKTKDMTDLIKFHEDVESVLENLTDESQVLSRFEGFPSKKLEAIRMAAALQNKLDSILNELLNWKILPPTGQLLDRIERYFNRIKTELDALERTKDEETKKFKSQNIEFDFHILIKIKEAMVDVSSSCMELALKERGEDIDSRSKSDNQTKELSKMLWRAFQFAFRVYTFAGGHDEQHDKLTRELAQAIEGMHHP